MISQNLSGHNVNISGHDQNRSGDKFKPFWYSANLSDHGINISDDKIFLNLPDHNTHISGGP